MDRHLLDTGGADAAREEQGLDVARGLADQQANTDKTYIPTVCSRSSRNWSNTISPPARQSPAAAGDRRMPSSASSTNSATN
jgi:hypothetical protein